MPLVREVYYAKPSWSGNRSGNASLSYVWAASDPQGQPLQVGSPIKLFSGTTSKPAPNPKNFGGAWEEHVAGSKGVEQVIEV
jgi:hypothetical protein